MIITHKSQVEYNSTPRNGVIIGWHLKCDGVFTNQLSQLKIYLDAMNTLNYPPISGNLYLFNKLTNAQRCYCRERLITDCTERPHYLILTDNNQIRYVEQSININSILLFVTITYLYDMKFINFILDTISKCLPNKQSKLINNEEIGRYFTRFAGTHYVPNENLAKLYPDDSAAILEIFSSQ